MSNQVRLASQVVIKLAGTEVQQDVMDNLASLVVDQHALLPGMFTIKFLIQLGPDDQRMPLIDTGPFDLTKEVEIIAKKEDDSTVTLIKGEITALEPSFGENMLAELVVRGFDRSHRLFRETKSKAFLNIKDSDLAQQIAGNAGLSPQVDTTSAVYDHLYQHNQTDMELLMQRAWRIGYECFVAEGKLYFRKPPTGGASVTLKWGDELQSFSPRMSLAEQVDEVMVRGWDPQAKKPIVGKATSGQLYPKTGESKDGKSWASTFGSGKKIVVDQPVVNQAEADALATARLNEISGTFVEAEGVAFRRPDIKAGNFIKIEALGTRFSGTYLVTSATHIYSPEGLKVIFNVKGSRTGLVSETLNMQPPLDRWPGVVTAIVTNVQEEKDWGMVKVKYPWMSEDAESYWARVLGVGAGPEAGFYVMPDVNDEVLVTFLHGDFNQPVVLGGLWNGSDALPPEGKAAAKAERPLVRTWHSRKGHWIAMHDTADNKIEIVSKGGRSMTINDADSKLIINTSNVTITLEDTKLNIDTSADITIKAGTNMTLESSANIKIKAGGNLEIEAGGNADLKASAMVNVKGSMINLN
jgi:phage protein D/phage baseplate assembly protein gpV